MMLVPRFLLLCALGISMAACGIDMRPLPEPPADNRTLTLEQLCSFFQHPVRYLLQHRLSLRLEEPVGGEQDNEPFQLDGLARYEIGQELLEKRLTGIDLAAYFDVQKATGSLPQGTVGETAYRELRTEAEDFAGATDIHIPGL